MFMMMRRAHVLCACVENNNNTELLAMRHNSNHYTRYGYANALRPHVIMIMFVIKFRL